VVSEGYEELKSAVAGISPLRNRAPFPWHSIRVWHYLFGIANQKSLELEAGLLSEPHAPGAAFQGYMSAVYVQGMGLSGEALKTIRGLKAD
jgi:hypothetical protein